MTQLVGYRPNNNNTGCYVIILSLLTGILELGICPPGLADVWHTTNYLLFRSFFFLPPPLHSHRLLSTIEIPWLILSDVARNVKSNLGLVGFPFQLQNTSRWESSALQGLQTPLRGSDHDKHGKQVPQLSLAPHCTFFPTCTETQTERVKLQISMQVLLTHCSGREGSVFFLPSQN